MSPTRNRCFWGELLLIIGLLVVVTGILVPVFAQGKVSRAEGICLSNLRQIAQAARLYAEDYDGTLFCHKTDARNPYAGQPGVSENAAKHTFFNQLLHPYAKSWDIWKCPANANAWVNADIRGAETVAAYRGYGGQNSYGANLYLFPAGNGLALSHIPAPARTALLLDARYYGVLPRNPPPAPKVRTSGEYAQHWKNLGNSYFHRARHEIRLPPSDAVAELLGKARHHGQIHVLFVDGQVRAVPYEDVVQDAGLWTPQR